MALHEYQVSVSWTGGREGSGEVEALNSGTSFDIAVPTEFGGPGEAANPEELLTSAIAACYGMTLGIILTNRKIPFEDIKVKATGQVEQSGMTFTYKAVKIVATIMLGAGAEEEQAKAAGDLANKAEQYCIITNAVRDRVAVTVEPHIVRL